MIRGTVGEDEYASRVDLTLAGAPDVDVRGGGGGDGDGDGNGGGFTRVSQVQTQLRRVHATAVGTILRPIGRPCANIMAPLSCGTSTPTSTSASVPHR